MSNFNHSSEHESAYTAVVDGNNINLTPLGKFVMPPPLFEKQVCLPSFATCLSMYGQNVLCYSEVSNEFYSFDCSVEKPQLKTLPIEGNYRITSI